MNATRILPVAFLALLVTGAAMRPESSPAATAAAIVELARANPPAVAGSFPTQWINGVDCASEEKVQVHEYDPDTYILRQSKCETYEAPFLYLLFGEDKVLMIDTGANPSTPIQRNVENVIRRWLRREQKTSIDLIVQHSHGHFDHIQGDGQFVGAPFVVEIAGVQQVEFERSWDFKNYPVDVPTIDLGGRVLDVLGTPGHHPAHVALYDRNTHLLLTGDIVYPGHLFVFSAVAWADFVDSIQRLVDWAATHPVEWVVGCHIEMSATPFESFAYGTLAHPNEHPLELKPEILAKILAASLAMGHDPECKIFEEFVIHPVYKCGIGWNG